MNDFLTFCFFYTRREKGVVEGVVKSDRSQCVSAVYWFRWGKESAMFVEKVLKI